MTNDSNSRLLLTAVDAARAAHSTTGNDYTAYALETILAAYEATREDTDPLLTDAIAATVARFG